MLKDILGGTKKVVVELSEGMKESCGDLSVKANRLFCDIEVKLMGSYDEIEAYEKTKELEAKESEK